MKNLLRTILTELENHKLMFRANAYELWNYGCEDMIVAWGYDQDKLIKTMQEVVTIGIKRNGGDKFVKQQEMTIRLF